MRSSFLMNEKGNTTLLSAFVAFLLISLSIFVYTGSMIYSKYRSAQTELERAISVAIDKSMENRNVRDLELNIPQELALADLESNLAYSGWELGTDGTWKRSNAEKVICEQRSLNIEVHKDVLDISGLFVMPLTWSIGNQTEVVIPITVHSKVIYLD